MPAPGMAAGGFGAAPVSSAGGRERAAGCPHSAWRSKGPGSGRGQEEEEEEAARRAGRARRRRRLAWSRRRGGLRGGGGGAGPG